jgi:ribonuclease HI
MSERISITNPFYWDLESPPVKSAPVKKPIDTKKGGQVLAGWSADVDGGANYWDCDMFRFDTDKMNRNAGGHWSGPTYWARITDRNRSSERGRGGNNGVNPPRFEDNASASDLNAANSLGTNARHSFPQDGWSSGIRTGAPSGIPGNTQRASLGQRGQAMPDFERQRYEDEIQHLRSRVFDLTCRLNETVWVGPQPQDINMQQHPGWNAQNAFPNNNHVQATPYYQNQAHPFAPQQDLSYSLGVQAMLDRTLGVNTFSYERTNIINTKADQLVVPPFTVKNDKRTPPKFVADYEREIASHCRNDREKIDRFVDILLGNPELEPVCYAWKSMASYVAARNRFIEVFWNSREQMKVIDAFERAVFVNSEKHSSLAAFYSYWSGQLKYISLPGWHESYKERIIQKLPPRIARAVDKTPSRDDFEIYNSIREEEQRIEKEKWARNNMVSRSGNPPHISVANAPATISLNMRSANRSANVLFAGNEDSVEDQSGPGINNWSSVDQWPLEYEETPDVGNVEAESKPDSAAVAIVGGDNDVSIWDDDLTLRHFRVTGDSAAFGFRKYLGYVNDQDSTLLGRGIVPATYLESLKNIPENERSEYLYSIVFLGRDLCLNEWVGDYEKARENIAIQLEEIIKTYQRYGSKAIIFIALNEYYKVSDARIFQKTRFYNQALIRAVRRYQSFAYIIPALGNFHRVKRPPNMPLLSTDLSHLVFFDHLYQKIETNGSPSCPYELSPEGWTKLKTMIGEKLEAVDAQMKFREADRYLAKFRLENAEDLGASVRLQVGASRILACMDTGSPFNIISTSLWNKIKSENKTLNFLSLRERMNLKGISNDLVYTEEIIRIPFLLSCAKTGDSVKFSAYFIVAGMDRSRVILGRAFLKSGRYAVNVPDQCLDQIDSKQKLYLSGEHRSLEKKSRNDADIIINSHTVMLQESINLPNLDPLLEHLPLERRTQVYSLILKYKSLFSERLGRCNSYQHTFEIDTQMPLRAKNLYTLSRRQTEIARPIIQRWIDNGVISVSQNSSRSPMTLQLKKNGKYRFCLDFREANKHLSSPNFEPPLIDNLKMEFGDAGIFSTIDFAEGFLQVDLADEHSKNITTFVFDGIPYRFEVTPYGTKASAAAFIAALTPILSDFREFCRFYIDDVIIFSRTYEEHIVHVDQVLQAILCSGMTLGLLKCQWFQRQVTYVGFEISVEEIRPKTSKIEEIVDSKPPTTVKGVRALMGLCNFYRSHIPNYAEIAEPIVRLTKKSVKFQWAEEQQTAWDRLKSRIDQSIQIAHPDFSQPFLIITHVSKKAIAAILYQSLNKGQVNIIGCCSRSYKPAEENYTDVEKEILAVYFCLKKFAYVLHYRKIIVYTNLHLAALLKANPQWPDRLIKWEMFMRGFEIEWTKNKHEALVLKRFLANTNEEEVMDHSKYFRQQFECLYFDVEPSDDLEHYMRNLEELQRNDPDIVRVLETHPEQCEKQGKYWVRRGKDGLIRLMIPAVMTNDLIEYYHRYYGHLGVSKTIATLLREYQWKGLRQQVYDKIKDCNQCMKNKVHAIKTRPKVAHVRAERPGELVCIDHFGPMPVARGGVERILVCLDVASRYVRLFPVKRADTRSTIERIKKLKEDVKQIDSILADNASCFISHEWQDWCKGQGIKLRRINCYSPQVNLAERVMTVLANHLRIQLEGERHTKWVDYVSDIEKCINETIQTTTGFPPVTLMHGIIPTDPVAQQLKGGEPMSLSREEKEARQLLANDRTRAAGEKRARRMPPPTEIRVGDIVKILTHKLSSKADRIMAKLCNPFEGPFVVEQVQSDNSYTIRHLITGEIRKENVRQIRICKSFLNEKRYEQMTEEALTIEDNNNEITAEDFKQFLKFRYEVRQEDSRLPDAIYTDNRGFQVLKDGAVLVYVDGACRGNGSKLARAGYGICFGVDHKENVSAPVLGKQTNNVAEITAIIEALKLCNRLGLKKVEIRTDSNVATNYIQKWRKDWFGGETNSKKKRGLELPLLYGLEKAMLPFSPVRFVKIKGHAGVWVNHGIADQLAKAATF